MTGIKKAPGTLPLEDLLNLAEQVILPVEHANKPLLTEPPTGKLHVGVDLGTAYIVLVVLDENKNPIAGEYQFAQVVRDGLVVDYIGAVDIVRAMKQRVEQRIGRQLIYAASGYPPGVANVEMRATANVVEAAELICTGLVDEPSAANEALQIEKGAIVDVGGGTTGIAIIQDGEVVYTADEATGGTHFSLVIAGSLGISFEAAEKIKKTASEQSRLFPIIRPVMEKIGSIVARHVNGRDVKQLTLVGGACSFPGMRKVIEEYTGIPTLIPAKPLFVTPIGMAMYNNYD